jgi:hypothetical protein
MKGNIVDDVTGRRVIFGKEKVEEGGRRHKDHESKRRAEIIFVFTCDKLIVFTMMGALPE